MRMSVPTLNQYLKQKRVDRGLSQLEVAKVLGYTSPQFVSNWERGLVSPPLDTMAVLIDLYKMKPEEVIAKILDETREDLETKLLRRKRRTKSGHARN